MESRVCSCEEVISAFDTSCLCAVKQMEARLELFIKIIVRGGHGPRKHLVFLLDVLEKWKIR